MESQADRATQRLKIHRRCGRRALTGELIAVGAILKGVGGVTGIEGARTTAAIHASHLGPAIKVSADGVVSLFKDGVSVWQL